eukprot:g3993.t1
MLYFLLYINMGILNVAVHHCGYEIPGDYIPGFALSMAHFHDYHHEVFNKNFGIIGVCDYIFGTYGKYYAAVDKFHSRNKQKQQ